MNATIATLVLLMTRFMLVEAAPCSSGCGPVLATPIAQVTRSAMCAQLYMSTHVIEKWRTN